MEQAQAAKARSLQDRWAELTRKIQLSVEIHELNDQGDYTPVEVRSNVSNVILSIIFESLTAVAPTTSKHVLM